MQSLGDNSDTVDRIEALLVSHRFLRTLKLLFMFVLTAFVAHWLACAMGMVRTRGLNTTLDAQSTFPRTKLKTI